jgi:hypothetical protein
MEMKKIISNLTILCALIFITNCAPGMRYIEEEEQVTSSFAESCNPTNDPSMVALCTCAETKMREQNDGLQNTDFDPSNNAIIRGISRGEMEEALDDCRF